MTPQQQEIWDLVQGGLSIRAAGRHLGKSASTANVLYNRAKLWMDADQSARAAAHAVNAQTLPKHYWAKTDGVSAFFKVDQPEETQNIAERIADVMSDIPRFEPMAARNTTKGQLAVYPLMDAHFGMKSWGRETGGQDYDLHHAARDLKQSFTDLCAEMPNSETAILVLGGDTLHADDNEGHTQSRRHVVDTDGRLYKAAEVAITAIEWVINLLCTKHSKLIIRVLRGNHDEHSHLILHFALAARFANAENIEIAEAQQDVFWYRHGVSLVAFHHGDKRNAKDLAMFLADACPEWSSTRDRHLLTGHIHHDSVKDFAGVKWWSLRAFCPSDKYGHMFGSRRALQGFIFCEKYGLKGTAIEPILREDEQK